MAALVQVSINFSTLNISHSPSKKLIFWGLKSLQKPIKRYNFTRAEGEYLRKSGFKKGVSEDRLSFLGGNRHRDGILIRGDRWMRSKRVVLTRFKEDFGFGGLGGGGGGGGRDNGATARVLGNLALAIGLTYLSMTGQFGWVLDAIVSIWLLAVILPIVGLGAFMWWAGRDIVQSSCPNCGNGFQVFKSTLNEDLQLCPFCSQPFSVVGNKFVRDPVKFSNQSTTFGDAFNEFYPRQKKKGKDTVGVVDVEAEVKDAD